ncbi:MAG TPA: helix-turn-helix domain-containing protein [Bosea sp. (in: a-proteobacteria)]|jgi:Cu(I)-responsive transcriptional regulator|uniref:MerR family transcriptional regulator n=1 Tax=Bosea sp. (in: a-proteobacteria) TaxID=1871050 RepID=UPI002E131B1D|nr:helix-turn-helix domain-containing protein [Bosea sp. (in: a-proteobacteria)]
MRPTADIERVVSIGALAERTGVKVETIRYYEQVGLLPPPERSEGNQRRYGRRHVERLAFIKHARDLGFAVDAIRALLKLSDNPTMACDDAHAIAVAHLDEVRHKIARLRSLEKELERIAATCSGGVAACDCAIIEALADHAQCSHAKH